jgi:V/A-type H+-transporting ATPase subunit I
MKKVAVVMLDAKRSRSVEALRDLGVVHLEEIRGKGPAFESLGEKRALIERALSLIPSEKKQAKDGAKSLNEEKFLELAARIVQRHEEKRALQDEADKLAKEIERVEPWGDFAPADIAACAEKGVNIHLYEVSTESVKNLPEGVRFFTIKSSKTTTLLAVASLGEQAPLSCKEVQLPRKGLSGLIEEAESLREKMDSVERELILLAGERAGLVSCLEDLDERLAFEGVRSGMNSEGSLAYLSGFVPAGAVSALKDSAAKNGWAVLVRDPDPEDTVPTLVQSPKAIRIIQPVFSMLGTIPGYRERDISVVFLLFFTIFFAMIIGDAGYGLIFLLASVYFSAKKRKEGGKVPDALRLMTLLSLFTVFWGAVTGNYFGAEAISKIAPFSWFIIPQLYNFSPESSANVQFICFILGTVQLSIAHIWNFVREVRQKPFIKAFAQLGWLSMVLGLYFFVLNVVLDAKRFPVPSFSLPMVLGGLAFVFIFAQQEEGVNFFKGALKGLAGFLPTILSSISAFSDIISYIRLFAVGLAGVEIAKSFNGMAANFGSTVTGIVAGVIVFVAGHGLNILMSILSVVVHGIRLNMLEFSGHLGMEWTGIAYKPFSARAKTE